MRPGDAIILEEIEVNLDYVDGWEGQGVEGYVPLTPVLFTWMSFGLHHSENERRYLLAATRRLDQAQALFERVSDLRQNEPEGAPAARRAAFALIGAIELAVVSLGRAVAMCTQARATINSTVPVPAAIADRRAALREIRNAYEHIEDRALGNVQRAEHPDALTIFNHHEVLIDGVIAYGNHRLDLQSDIPVLIAATRLYLKDVAGEEANPKPEDVCGFDQPSLMTSNCTASPANQRDRFGRTLRSNRFTDPDTSMSSVTSTISQPRRSQ